MGKGWVVCVRGKEKPADADPKEVQKVEKDGRSVVVVEVTWCHCSLWGIVAKLVKTHQDTWKVFTSWGWPELVCQLTKVRSKANGGFSQFSLDNLETKNFGLVHNFILLLGVRMFFLLNLQSLLIAYWFVPLHVLVKLLRLFLGAVLSVALSGLPHCLVAELVCYSVNTHEGPHVSVTFSLAVLSKVTLSNHVM